MTKKEKTDEIKRYVDDFSLKIAMRLSQMDNFMKPIGNEQELEQGVDHFDFLRRYLVQILEQQQFWVDLGNIYVKENSEYWIQDLIKKRERLARLEFQFYSQTLQLRDISDYMLLVKMLKFILRTSDAILSLNEEIHSIISSERFIELITKDKRLEPLASYTNKSRAIEHNFGNILQILTKM